jgi:hypothetical protein
MITKEYPSKCQTRYSATEHEALSRGRSNTAKHKDEREPRALAATSVFRGTCVLDCPVSPRLGSRTRSYPDLASNLRGRP